MSDNARSRALLILRRWENEGVPLDLVMAEALRQPFAEPRDLQFCRALVSGVVCWRGYLDAILAGLSSHPLAQMKPLTRQALRCGLYQLLFMDRVPASAAINETVRLLKEAGQPRWLTGFVNGILRRVSRESATLPRPGELSGAGLAMASHDLLSHPHWLYQRWAGRYGEETAQALCRANNLGGALTLRVVDPGGHEELLAKLRAAGITAEAGQFAPRAVLLPGFRGAIANLTGYAEGWFQVQDEAAQLVVPLLGGLEQGRCLDACAGLGGKTTHMAELAGPGVQVVAVEPEARRFALLEANLKRLGLSGKVETRSGSIADLAAAGDGRRFQAILVDAPCSGLGVIRRHPDIRWNRKEAELLRYQCGQLALLEQAAALLAPGGVLVYATCSTEPEENEQTVELFLARHQDFQIASCGEHLPPSARDFAGADGFFRTRPDQGLDGFFAARLVKN